MIFLDSTTVTSLYPLVGLARFVIRLWQWDLAKPMNKLELWSPMNFPHRSLEGMLWQEHINTGWRISDHVITFVIELETCLIIVNNGRLKSYELGGTSQCMISVWLPVLMEAVSTQLASLVVVRRSNIILGVWPAGKYILLQCLE